MRVFENIIGEVHLWKRVRSWASIASEFKSSFVILSDWEAAVWKNFLSNFHVYCATVSLLVWSWLLGSMISFVLEADSLFNIDEPLLCLVKVLYIWCDCKGWSEFRSLLYSLLLLLSYIKRTVIRRGPSS